MGLTGAGSSRVAVETGNYSKVVARMGRGVRLVLVILGAFLLLQWLVMSLVGDAPGPEDVRDGGQHEESVRAWPADMDGAWRAAQPSTSPTRAT